MGKKKRVSSHNGRWGSARHNGRDFNLSKAEHIDSKRTKDNVYWTWDCGYDIDEAAEFTASELDYYQEQFGEALARQNEVHRSRGQYKRVKTMEQAMGARQKRPEETILQIGNKSDNVDAKKFLECVEDYIAWEEDWNKAHGNPFKTLNIAVHYDETSPHAHRRRVWQYQDPNGIWQIGQNKALAAAGVPLPDPAQPESAENNRKMVYDAMCRGKWLDICAAHGYDVEREPDPKHRAHIPKQQYIDLQEREKDLTEREKTVSEREKVLQEKEAAIELRQKAIEDDESDFKARLDRIQAEFEEAVKTASEARIEALRADAHKRASNLKKRELNYGKYAQQQKAASKLGLNELEQSEADGMSLSL